MMPTSVTSIAWTRLPVALLAFTMHGGCNSSIAQEAQGASEGAQPRLENPARPSASGKAGLNAMERPALIY